MATQYSDLDKIRAVNGKQFIADIRRYKPYVRISNTTRLLPVLKTDIMFLARDVKIEYRISTTERGKSVMVLY